MPRKRKLKLYRVTLCGEIPATAYLDVEAENEDQAKGKAEEQWADADWQGGDYDRPEGATVEAYAAEELS